jgi:hypothetical protein
VARFQSTAAQAEAERTAVMSASTKKTKVLRMPQREPIEVEVPLPKELTDAERARLQVLEDTMEKSWQALATAITEIRDRRLYRADYDTFEQYCQERWNYSKTHANRLVAGAEVNAIVAPVGVTLPTERIARPLTLLLKQPEVLLEVAKTIDWEHATAETVQAAVDERRDGGGKPRSRTTSPTSKPILKNTEDTFKTAAECLKSLKMHGVLTSKQATPLLAALNKITDQLWKYVAENKR